MENNYTDILRECIKIAKERQLSYGKATESIKKSVDILKELFNIILTPTEFCFVMVSLKLGRGNFKFKKDSLIDCINYLAIGIACQEKYDTK